MAGRLTIVGLGPADELLLTPQTSAAIAAAEVVFVRTRRHPAAAVLGDVQSFDEIYDQADTFEAVYQEIAERLIAATSEGEVLYAVPGSPLVLERTVELLRAASDDGRLDLEILPAT